MMAEEKNMVPLATPTRFLIENGEWNLTPGLSIQPEMNPFDCSLNDLKHSDNHVVTEKWSSTQSNSTASPILYDAEPLDTKTMHATTTHTTTTTTTTHANTSTTHIMNDKNMNHHPSHPPHFLTSPPIPPMSLSQSPSSTSTSFSISEPHDEQQQQQHYIYSSSSSQPHEQPIQETMRRSSRIQTRPQPVYNNSQQQQQQQQDIDKKEEYPSQQRKPSTSGRKRRIVFEGEDAEDRRKKFLERNRIAAYKCRQKKKNWMQELEQKAEIQNMQNETLRTLVGQLKEESMYLKNLLLTHGNCDCESVQAYLRKTSMEITNSTSPLLNSTNHNPYALRRESMYSTASYPTNISSNTSYPASGLTPFLNTVINKPPMTEADYFSHSHHHHGKTNDIEA